MIWGWLTASHNWGKQIVKLVGEGVTRATLLVDGRRYPSFTEDGFFYGRYIVRSREPGMLISLMKKSLAPALCLRVFQENVSTRLRSSITISTATEHASSLAMATQRGLLQSEVTAGMVGINVPLPVPVANHSFGGWKESRFGDLAAYGPDGVRFFYTWAQNHHRTLAV